MDKKWHLISVGLVLVAMIFAFWNGSQHSKAAGTCTVTKAYWSVNPVVTGSYSSFNWEVSGADSVKTQCSTDGILKDVASSGSINYPSVNGPIVCGVFGYVGGVQQCVDSSMVTQVNYPGTGNNNLPSSGGEHCYFTGSNISAGSNGQNSSADTQVTIPSGGFPGGIVPEAVENFNLGWTAVDKNGQQLQSSAGYSAILSSPGLANGSYGIGGASVPLTGTYAASLGGSYDDTNSPTRTKYTVSISKNGTGIASCSLDFSHGYSLSFSEAGELTKASGSLPPDGSYTITGTASTTFPAIYGYSDPLIGPTLEIMSTINLPGGNLGFSLGQYHKSILMNRTVFKGPVARWDLSDPLHPRNPQKLDGIGPMPAGNGPLSWRAWGHESDMGQVLYAENQDGEGRVSVDYANYFTDNTDALVATADPSTGKLSLGEKYSDKYVGYELNGKWVKGIDSSALLRSPGIVVATPSDRFFAYFSSSISTKIFDVTDLSGSVRPSPTPNNTYCYGPDSGCLEHVSTAAWANVLYWKVIQYPGSDTQYLMGVIPGTNKATVRLAQIDPDTGSLLNPKSITLNVGFLNPQPVYVGGKIYIIASEGIDVIIPRTLGNMRLGIYSLDTAKLALKRTGGIKLDQISGGQWGIPDVVSVVNSEDGSGYPLLEAFSAGGSIVDYGSGIKGFNPNYKDTYQFYGLKNILTTSSSEPKPDFQVEAIPYKSPMIMGEVVHNQWPYKDNGFLRKEGNKTYLYLYRFASIYEGSRVYADFPYKLVKADVAIKYDPPKPSDQTDSFNLFVGQRVLKGDIGLRADKIDVTSLTGVGSALNPPGGGSPPNSGTGTGSGGPTIGAGGDCYSKYKGNTQLVSLCELIESIKQQACAKQSTLSFCSSLSGAAQ